MDLTVSYDMNYLQHIEECKFRRKLIRRLQKISMMKVVLYKREATLYSQWLIVPNQDQKLEQLKQSIVNETIRVNLYDYDINCLTEYMHNFVAMLQANHQEQYAQAVGNYGSYEYPYNTY